MGFLFQIWGRTLKSFIGKSLLKTAKAVHPIVEMTYGILHWVKEEKKPFTHLELTLVLFLKEKKKKHGDEPDNG